MLFLRGHEGPVRDPGGARTRWSKSSATGPRCIRSRAAGTRSNGRARTTRARSRAALAPRRRRVHAGGALMPRKNRRNPEFFLPPEAPVTPSRRADAPDVGPGARIRRARRRRPEGVPMPRMRPHGARRDRPPRGGARPATSTPAVTGTPSAGERNSAGSGPLPRSAGRPIADETVGAAGYDARHGALRRHRAERPPTLGLHPRYRVEAPAVRPVRAPDGARARPLQVPVLPLHPSLLRLVTAATGSGTGARLRRRHTMPRMAFEARARMWEAGGRWYARILDAPAYIEVTGISRHGCLDELRKVTGDDVTLTVERDPDDRRGGRGRRDHGMGQATRDHLHRSRVLPRADHLARLGSGLAARRRRGATQPTGARGTPRSHRHPSRARRAEPVPARPTA